MHTTETCRALGCATDPNLSSFHTVAPGPRCSCAHNTDGTATTMMCPLHADTDPCWTMARVTGRRRVGSIIRGKCSSCGHVDA